jgi:hypothetical protein
MTLLLAKIDDGKTLFGKLSWVKTPGKQSIVAYDTQREITFEPHLLYPVVAVCENMDNAFGLIPDYVPVPKVKPEPQVVEENAAEDEVALQVEDKPQKNGNCEKCGGRKRGRGYAHIAGCELDSRVILAAKQAESRKNGETCPECGGGKRGRGFSHGDKCSKGK